MVVKTNPTHLSLRFRWENVKTQKESIEMMNAFLSQFDDEVNSYVKFGVQYDRSIELTIDTHSVLGKNEVEEIGNKIFEAAIKNSEILSIEIFKSGVSSTYESLFNNNVGYYCEENYRLLDVGIDNDNDWFVIWKKKYNKH